MKHRRVLHWFRRDLRLTDNTALLAAWTEAQEVIPVYILSDWHGTHRWTGEKRQSFLYDCLRALAADLKEIGSCLILRRGDPLAALGQLIAETDATAIYANQDPDVYGRKTEAALCQEMASCGIEVSLHHDHSIHDPTSILTGSQEPYRVFTPYAKSWRAAKRKEPQTALPRHNNTPPPALETLPLPTVETWGLPEITNPILPGGEKAARKRLSHFLQNGLTHYEETRDLPALSGTSRISQDLRFGLLSIRETVQCVSKTIEQLPATKKIQGEKFLSELIWREFYLQLLWHYPRVLEEEFSPVFRGMTWHGKPDAFDRWKNAETGFPIVDAGIRGLVATGFMHNRVRMIVAMFLTKDLHVDWRCGEQWFLQHLLDGEIASNNGGWQWSAGTGADAAPYFRIQNPWTQTKRYDPDGKYIKKWLPELAALPASAFFAPPPEGESLAKNYPAPMVDHGAERTKTLEIFSNWKLAGTKRSSP